MKGIVWPRFLGKEVVLRDTAASEYKGTLRAWDDDVITLEANGSEVIVIRRESVISVRGPGPRRNGNRDFERAAHRD